MASGGDFSSSLSLCSDQLFDQNCTVCEDDNKVREAICYCTVCYKYYCESCSDFHNKFHRDHREKILDGAAMLKSPPKRPDSVALTMACEEHVNELLQMYCYEHEVVCCTVCLAISHKTCNELEYIPKIANGFSKDPDVAKTKSELQKIREDLVTIRSIRQNDQTRIKEEKEHVLVQVEDARVRINVVLDKLKDAVIKEADTRYESLDENIQTDLKACENIINKIEKAMEELEDTDMKHDAQLFVHVKKGEQNIEVWLPIVDQIQENIGKEKIKFEIDGDIQDYLDGLENLGKFVDEMMKPKQRQMAIHEKEAKREMVTAVDTLNGANRARKGIREERISRKQMANVNMLNIDLANKQRRNSDVIGKTPTEDDILMEPSQLRRVNSDKAARKKKGENVDSLKVDRQPRVVIAEGHELSKLQASMTRQSKLVIVEKDIRRTAIRRKAVCKLRTIVRHDDAIVKMKKDSNTCSIVGSCYLPDGGALLTDSNNNKLKRTNSSNMITDTCNVLNPHGVCYIQPSNEAAVSVKSAILIVSLGKKMNCTRSIKTGNVNCYGLVYSNDRLYVSQAWGYMLHVYEYATGRLSINVDTDSQGKNIFSRTQHVATNRDGTQIWVADYDKGLIQFDKNLKVIRVIKFDEMGGIRGVCVDNEDNVYACGEFPRNVLQLTSNGEDFGTLLPEDKLAGDPTSLSYDNKRSRLMVTMFETDTRHLLQFK